MQFWIFSLALLSLTQVGNSLDVFKTSYPQNCLDSTWPYYDGQLEIITPPSQFNFGYRVYLNSDSSKYNITGSTSTGGSDVTTSTTTTSSTDAIANTASIITETIETNSTANTVTNTTVVNLTDLSDGSTSTLTMVTLTDTPANTVTTTTTVAINNVTTNATSDELKVDFYNGTDGTTTTSTHTVDSVQTSYATDSTANTSTLTIITTGVDNLSSTTNTTTVSIVTNLTDSLMNITTSTNIESPSISSSTTSTQNNVAPTTTTTSRRMLRAKRPKKNLKQTYTAVDVTGGTVGCYHDHIYKFQLGTVVAESSLDSTFEHFNGDYWPMLGFPEIMCTGRIDALFAPTSLNANEIVDTWSDGAWGQPCGWYVEYSWTGSNGGVYFELYSQNAISLALGCLSALTLLFF